jgi:hypothetical protein
MRVTVHGLNGLQLEPFEAVDRVEWLGPETKTTPDSETERVLLVNPGCTLVILEPDTEPRPVSHWRDVGSTARAVSR